MANAKTCVIFWICVRNICFERNGAKVFLVYVFFKAQENQRFLGRINAMYYFIGDKILAP